MDRLDEIVDEATARLRELEPDAIAIVLTGSYARGTADEHSDLDVRAITSGEPRGGYRTWFAKRRERKPLHVSLGARSLQYWLAARNEPAYWTFGFPTVYEASYVWATPEARADLGADPSIHRPAGPPLLEGLIELATKIRRAGGQHDDAGVRFYARKVGEAAPRTLLPLNKDVVVRNTREALDAALSLPIAPDHYREDLSVCLALGAASVEDVERAALRLTHEVLAFLRERRPDVDPQPGMAEYLADGTLERHLGFLD